MKNINLAGRLGKDAELRRTNSGDPVLQFSVAVDDGYGENKKTLWFDCSLWGKRGESLSKHLSKGSAVAVSGDLSQREHNGKTYLSVRVNDVTLQGGNSSERDNSRHTQQQDQGSQGGGFDDDIPF